jgi:hypothetical protein
MKIEYDKYQTRQKLIHNFKAAASSRRQKKSFHTPACRFMYRRHASMHYGANMVIV